MVGAWFWTIRAIEGTRRYVLGREISNANLVRPVSPSRASELGDKRSPLGCWFLFWRYDLYFVVDSNILRLCSMLFELRAATLDGFLDDPPVVEFLIMNPLLWVRATDRLKSNRLRYARKSASQKWRVPPINGADVLRTIRALNSFFWCIRICRTAFEFSLASNFTRVLWKHGRQLFRDFWKCKCEKSNSIVPKRTIADCIGDETVESQRLKCKWCYTINRSRICARS